MPRDGRSVRRPVQHQRATGNALLARVARACSTPRAGRDLRASYAPTPGRVEAGCETSRASACIPKPQSHAAQRPACAMPRAARAPLPGDASPAPHCHAGRDLRAAPAARRVRAAAGARLPARASACGASPQGRTHKMTVQISPSGSRSTKVIPGPVRRRSPRNACTWVENSPRPEHGYIIVSRGPLARPHQKSGKLRLCLHATATWGWAGVGGNIALRDKPDNNSPKPELTDGRWR